MQGLMLGGGGMAMNKADEGPVPACPGSVFGEFLVGRLWLSQ